MAGLTRRNRYSVTRGAYTGTVDDRIDRWYIHDHNSTTIDRRGPGYFTKREALAEAHRLNAAHVVIEQP